MKIEPDFGYGRMHTIMAYAVFGLAFLGIWKLIEIIISLF